MFPNGYPADALGSCDLLVTTTVGKAETEDALLLFGQTTGYKLANGCQSFVFIIGIVSRFSIVTAFDGT